MIEIETCTQKNALLTMKHMNSFHDNNNNVVQLNNFNKDLNYLKYFAKYQTIMDKNENKNIYDNRSKIMENDITDNYKDENNNIPIKNKGIKLNKKRINGFTSEEEAYIKKLSSFFCSPIIQNKIRNMNESNRNIEYGILKFANIYGIAFTINNYGKNIYHYKKEFYELLNDLKEEGQYESMNLSIYEIDNTTEKNIENKKEDPSIYFYNTNELIRVFDSHHDNVNTFKKIQFDCFRRDDSLRFYYSTNEFFITTIGQLNFLEWYFKKNIDQFIKDHILIIKYLNKLDSQLKKYEKLSYLTKMTNSDDTFIVKAHENPDLHVVTHKNTIIDISDSDLKTNKKSLRDKIINSKIANKLRLETKKKKKSCLQSYRIDIQLDF